MVRDTSVACQAESPYFMAMIPKVKAAPMYPDFPSQVMAMDEAVFRFHQMVHYFSTYGLEDLFGIEVREGWLPDSTETPKTETDKTLLDAKVLSLAEEDGLYRRVYEQLLMRRERMTIPEKELVEECVRHADDSFLDVKAAFKENLIPVFRIIMEQAKGPRRISMLKRGGTTSTGRMPARTRLSAVSSVE